MHPEILFTVLQYKKFEDQSRAGATAGVSHDCMNPFNTVTGKEQLSQWTRARCKQKKQAVRS